jgi:hypothetical protein
MGPDASPMASVFSSRVITRELLSQGSSRLLEARRVVSSAAFARSGSRATGGSAIPQVRLPNDRRPTATNKKPAAAPRSMPVTLSADPDGVAVMNHAWTFTYANGTFSTGDGRRISNHLRLGVGPRPVVASSVVPMFPTVLPKAA